MYVRRFYMYEFYNYADKNAFTVLFFIFAEFVQMVIFKQKKKIENFHQKKF